VQLRDEIKRQQNEEIKKIAEASRSLHEWRARVTAVFSDAGNLFESEPIREFIDRFGPRPTLHPAEPRGDPRGERGSTGVGDGGAAWQVLSLVGEEMARGNDNPRAGPTRN
jgi:hypothetical protein